jgi:hypothetical protein
VTDTPLRVGSRLRLFPARVRDATDAADPPLGDGVGEIRSVDIREELTEMAKPVESTDVLGLSEQELRERLSEELLRAMRAEGNVPTVHAIAHSVARVIADDHLLIAEQLGRTGIPLKTAE